MLLLGALSSPTPARKASKTLKRASDMPSAREASSPNATQSVERLRRAGRRGDALVLCLARKSKSKVTRYKGSANVTAPRTGRAWCGGSCKLCLPSSKPLPTSKARVFGLCPRQTQRLSSGLSLHAETACRLEEAPLRRPVGFLLLLQRSLRRPRLARKHTDPPSRRHSRRASPPRPPQKLGLGKSRREKEVPSRPPDRAKRAAVRANEHVHLWAKPVKQEFVTQAGAVKQARFVTQEISRKHSPPKTPLRLCRNSPNLRCENSHRSTAPPRPPPLPSRFSVRKVVSARKFS